MNDDLKSEIAEVFRMFDEEDTGAINVSELASALYTITGEHISREDTMLMMNRYDKDHSGEIDMAEFETLVMERLKGRTFQEEMTRAFKLLEDKDVPGYITRDSLKKAAMSIGERLSDTELSEMFDQLITGHSGHNVDFSTFSSIQYAAEQDSNSVTALNATH